MKRYLSDKVCKHGHSPERYISTDACCECIAAGRDRRRANPEKKAKELAQAAKRKRELYREDSSKRLAANSEWKRKNKEKVQAINLNRLARQKAAEGSFTQQDILDIYEEQGAKCPGCLRSFCTELPYTIDHFVPISKGGTNWPANLQLLCGPCNASKKDTLWSVWINK